MNYRLANISLDRLVESAYDYFIYHLSLSAPFLPMYDFFELRVYALKIHPIVQEELKWSPWIFQSN